MTCDHHVMPTWDGLSLSREIIVADDVQDNHNEGSIVAAPGAACFLANEADPSWLSMWRA